MAYKIVWTENALEDYQNITQYLLENWPLNVTEKFVANMNRRLAVLSVHPFIGLASEKDLDIRSILLTKHERLYYTVTGDTIIILDIFDLRQDPSRNKY